MNEPSRGRTSRFAIRRVFLAGLAVVTALVAPRADAGAIRPHHAARVGARSVVAIEKADPDSDFWVRALKNHTLHLRGPRVPMVVALNADGSTPDTAFVRYMAWREGLNAKRFDAFHAEIAQLLRRRKPTPTPGTIPPLTGPVPVGPPDFTPITPGTQTLLPPHVPEPSAGLAAIVLLGAGLAGRRLARRP